MQVKLKNWTRLAVGLHPIISLFHYIMMDLKSIFGPFHYVLLLVVLTTLCNGQNDETPADKDIEAGGTLPLLCQLQCPGSVNGTRTFIYCGLSDNFVMMGRCCVNNTQDAMDNSIKISVLGIDLQNCSLAEQGFAAGIQNMSSLAVISLEGNPMANVTSADFNQNNNITYLSLPSKLSCPGGKAAWLSISKDDTRTICHNELNPCVYHNVSCPDNSHCAQAGIESTQCLCDEGFYGYKCLNKGTFPVIPYIAGLVGSTIVLSLLLWLTQRRHVKPKTR